MGSAQDVGNRDDMQPNSNGMADYDQASNNVVRMQHHYDEATGTVIEGNAAMYDQASNNVVHMQHHYDEATGTAIEGNADMHDALPPLPQSRANLDSPESMQHHYDEATGTVVEGNDAMHELAADDEAPINTNVTMAEVNSAFEFNGDFEAAEGQVWARNASERSLSPTKATQLSGFDGVDSDEELDV